MFRRIFSVPANAASRLRAVLPPDLTARLDSASWPRIPAELRPWASQLRAVLDQPGGGEAFIALLTYIELVSEAPASELHDTPIF